MRQGPTLSRVPLALAVVMLGTGFLAAETAEEWVLPDSRLGVRTAPILLLSRPDIQNDLKLSTEQVLSTRRAIRDLYNRAASLKGLPDAEAITARRSIDEAQQRWLETQLNDEQRARLFQVDLQWEGPSAVITRPWLATRLGLSAEQRQALSQAVAHFDPRQHPASGGPPDERPLAQQVLATLTPEQRQQWKALLGHPLAIQTASAPATTTRR